MYHFKFLFGLNYLRDYNINILFKFFFCKYIKYIYILRFFCKMFT